MKRVRTAGIVLALIVGSLTVSTGAAAAYEPPAGPVFNNPKGGHAATWKIVETVNRAIRGTPKGARIQLSNYLWDARSSTDALIRAKKRGVQVQVILDGEARNGQSRRMARVLNRDNGKKVKGKKVIGGPDRSYVKFCKRACRGGGVPNHTKYYTFTKTGTARNVIMVSSSNLNKGGAKKGFNDLYIAKERTKLIEDFALAHSLMFKDGGNPKYLEFVRGNLTARFYPKRTGADPVMQDLKKVHCKGANGGAGRGGRTAINISMFRWNNPRGFKIARKLVALERQGCHVSIVYGAPGKNVVAILRASAARGGIKLWDSRVDKNEDGKVDLRVHHKYMAISGNYGNDRSSWRVHTGSQNWGQSLRAGDENTLNIVSRSDYRKYMNNWNWLVKNAAHKVPQASAKMVARGEALFRYGLDGRLDDRP